MLQIFIDKTNAKLIWIYPDVFLHTDYLVLGIIVTKTTDELYKSRLFSVPSERISDPMISFRLDVFYERKSCLYHTRLAYA